MQRRNFVKNGLSGLALAMLPHYLYGFWHDNDQYPYRSLSEAFQYLKFDPAQDGSTFFVVTADVHYGSAGDGMLATIREVNKMDPLPAFFCVNGDLILSGSLYFGNIPDEKQRDKANQEFKAFKAVADQLHPDIPLKLTLGNHDTSPKEVDPLMFWKVYPGYPPYQSFDIGNIHFTLLNGHSTGYIDHTQLEWLKADVKKIPGNQTVVILVHQPSMSHRVRERGIPAAVAEAFDGHKGNLWLIGGHEHHNLQMVFQLENTKLIEHHITCGTMNIWGGPEKPGYWIYCLRHGQVVGRIFRQRFKGYRHQILPDLTQAEQVPMPFDHLKNIAWKLMVGDGDRDFLIHAQAGDCLNYWAYVKDLIYRFPLSETGNKCNFLAMLVAYDAQNIQKPGQYFISADQKDWMELTIYNNDNALYDVLMFSIPERYRTLKNIYFRFEPGGEAMVGGFALLT
jgi:predicted MPP superfamily phosphohydrolase